MSEKHDLNHTYEEEQDYKQLSHFNGVDKRNVDKKRILLLHILRCQVTYITFPIPLRILRIIYYFSLPGIVVIFHFFKL
jgi:hypothetical protein